MLNAALIIFCIALATYVFYLIQCDVNAQVEEFRSTALPFSVRLAFARVRLQNAEDRLARLGGTESGELTDYVFFVQKRLVIKQYVEIDAEAPLKALEQAEKYRRWWWTGIVDAPVLVQCEKEAMGIGFLRRSERE